MPMRATNARIPRGGENIAMEMSSNATMGVAYPKTGSVIRSKIASVARMRMSNVWFAKRTSSAVARMKNVSQKRVDVIKTLIVSMEVMRKTAMITDRGTWLPSMRLN